MKIRKTYLMVLVGLILCTSNVMRVFCQLGINSTNTAPNAKAMLDVESPNKGVLLPRLSVGSRNAISSPPNGLMLYNTTDNRFNFWNGSNWQDFNSLSLPYTGTGVEISGGQAGLFKIINTGTGNGFYVKAGTGTGIIATQAYAGYFESSENGIFAGGGAGKLALKTYGKLMFLNNSEATNSILTSIDANGTAAWRSTATLTGLNVEGTSTIGVNGTPITEIIKVTRTGDIGSIEPQKQGTLTFAIANAQPGSTVYISPTSNLPVGVIIAHALCETAGAVEVKFFNASNSIIDPPSQNYHIVVIR